MTTQTPVTVEIEKWLWFRFRFFPNFWLRGRIRSERKTQNPAGVDSGNPDPVPPLQMAQTLELQLPGETEPPGKNIVSCNKDIFCQCSLLNPMRSLSKYRRKSFKLHQVACYYNASILLKQLLCVIIETPRVIAMVYLCIQMIKGSYAS